jgi:2-C-methyl-D-erythritol 2,4-cyclodiphosphate synthase
MTPRVGLGFDIHPFSDDPARRLRLGGIELEGPGLAGHSDADVVAHAVTDALFGAAAMGDIGSHFPDTDPAFAGADSMDLLARAVLSVSTRFEIGNVDVTVVIEAPKLAPHREAMQARLAEVLGAPASIKAKRAESLGAIGRGEGVACFAVALLMPR